MLNIYFKNGEQKTYQDNEYTDYSYRKEVFVVMKGDRWIGIYSTDVIHSIEYNYETKCEPPITWANSTVKQV